MKGKPLTMLAVGEVILELPQGEYYLAQAAPVLKSGDVVIGQGEVAFTSRGVSTYVDMFPSPGCPPGNMGALATAGFNVITLAGNHIWDMGAPGIEDTIEGLRSYGIAAVGAGMNIDEARRPLILERDGTRFGFLNYNCVGTMGHWATQGKPGCAYVHVIAHYETNGGNLGGPPAIYTFADPRSLQAMVEDVQNLRPLCDILTVVFHKGISHTTDIAMYDHQVSYAAIDAGADLILGHHAQILKGVEQYKGKFIFHDIGRFVTATKGLTEKQVKEMRSLAAPNLSGSASLQQDPARNLTMIAKFVIENRKISRVGFLPCMINAERQAEVLKNDERGQRVFDFMDKATRSSGLNTHYEWKGDEILVRGDKT